MRVHTEGCPCWRCYANSVGSWLDFLCSQMISGKADIFLTLTARTPNYPWRRGFPIAPTQPSQQFIHRIFDRLILRLTRKLHSRIDFIRADQLGTLNGRLHLHAILSGDGLAEYPRTEIWQWLYDRSGFNRVLPFERGAAYYISRYIGRDVCRCDWQMNIGNRPYIRRRRVGGGGQDVALSPALSKNYFRLSLRRWHR